MCQFSIPFSGNADGLISRARQAIERAGGSLTGDTNQGTFQASTPIGAIQGGYTVNGQEITIAIDKKPFLLSCNRIETELRGVMK